MNILFLLQNAWGLQVGISPICFKPNENNKSAKVCRKIIGKERRLLFSNCSPVMTDKAKDNPGRDLNHTCKIVQKFKHYDLLIVCGNEAQKAFLECGEFFPNTIWFMPHPASRTLTNNLLNEMKIRLDNFQQDKKFLSFKQYIGRFEVINNLCSLQDL